MKRVEPNKDAEREPLPALGERWFRVWLMVLPVVVWVSHAMMENQWQRTWSIVHPEETAASPPDKLWWYAASVGIGFSLVYLGVARLYRSSSPEK